MRTFWGSEPVVGQASLALANTHTSLRLGGIYLRGAFSAPSVSSPVYPFTFHIYLSNKQWPQQDRNPIDVATRTNEAMT